MSATIRDRAERALKAHEQRSLHFPHIQLERADFATRTRACEAMNHLLDIHVDPNEWKPQGAITDVFALPDYRLSIEGLTFVWIHKIDGVGRELKLVVTCPDCNQERVSKNSLGSLYHLGIILSKDVREYCECKRKVSA